MSRVTYSGASPYAQTGQFSWRLGLYVDRSIPAQDTDTQIVVEPKYEHRPDLLAYDLYGSPAYWWVFMRRNLDVIRDPIWDMKAGITITVPAKEALAKILS